MFPVKLIIHSHISHKISLKKHFKGVKNLEIEYLFHLAKHFNPKVISYRLWKISHNLTPRQTLDLYNCTSYSYLNFTDVLSILKNFISIKTLYLPLVKSQTLLSSWLRLCKFLKTFKFSANPLTIETKISDGSPSKDQMSKKFFQMLQNMRISQDYLIFLPPCF